jgi:hypothetical protein
MARRRFNGVGISSPYAAFHAPFALRQADGEVSMFASMNFLSKSAFRRAVLLEQVPVVLWSPVQGVPAINGPVRVTGPWPGTRPPVEEIRGKDRRAHQRERVVGWHADVVVSEMRIVEVH